MGLRKKKMKEGRACHRVTPGSLEEGEKRGGKTEKSPQKQKSHERGRRGIPCLGSKMHGNIRSAGIILEMKQARKIDGLVEGGFDANRRTHRCCIDEVGGARGKKWRMEKESRRLP